MFALIWTNRADEIVRVIDDARVNGVEEHSSLYAISPQATRLSRSFAHFIVRRSLQTIHHFTLSCGRVVPPHASGGLRYPFHFERYPSVSPKSQGFRATQRLLWEFPTSYSRDLALLYFLYPQSPHFPQPCTPVWRPTLPRMRPKYLPQAMCRKCQDLSDSNPSKSTVSESTKRD